MDLPADSLRRFIIRSWPRLGAIALILLQVQFATVSAQSSSKKDPALAIEHVTVLPMTATGAQEVHDTTVLIRDGRIASIAPSPRASIPEGARRINGSGKWLMPGLTDMHVHLPNDRAMRLILRNPGLRDGTLRDEDIFALFIVNGVTQVLDLQSMSETLRQRYEVETGQILGPHIKTAAMIDGLPPQWPIGTLRVAAAPEDGRQAVRDVSAEGYDFIKAYSHLSLETFSAIVDEARKLNMRVVGHIPQRGKGLTEKFFQPGYDLVAHAEEFAQQTDPPSIEAIPGYVAMAKRNGTWLIGTLSLDERILQAATHPESLKTRPELRLLPEPLQDFVINHNPYVQASPAFIKHDQEIIEFNGELVRAFTKAGIPILAGTDSGVPGLVYGFALHDELEAMAHAGMSNQQVLEGATRLACEWLGVDADRGTVEEGKRADLLLLDADPLANVANTRKIAAVIAGGRYVTQSDLARMLKAVTDHNAARATAP
jgi:imidazolonepropionase-like amidohydrolase